MAGQAAGLLVAASPQPPQQSPQGRQGQGPGHCTQMVA
jgi:hypothetical protein